jgi:PTH1 family peptidyl-tRNA hydrolase
MGADLLAVGLGNPGPEFDGSRHNYGAVTVRLVASRHAARLRAERGTSSETSTVRLEGKVLVLATPQTYMNDSGLAVQLLTRRYLEGDKGLLADRLVVIHDEFDLPPGTVRIKEGGGTAGHNGLRSIQSHLHTQGFLRIRIGIGKPPGRTEGVDHVLKSPSKKDRELLEVAVEVAADAVETITSEGVATAMNRFNTKL